MNYELYAIMKEFREECIKNSFKVEEFNPELHIITILIPDDRISIYFFEDDKNEIKAKFFSQKEQQKHIFDTIFNRDFLR